MKRSIAILGEYCPEFEPHGHPFFIATLFESQARSTPAAPHPLVTAFVQATAERSGRATSS